MGRFRTLVIPYYGYYNSRAVLSALRLLEIASPIPVVGCIQVNWKPLAYKEISTALENGTPINKNARSKIWIIL